MKKCPFCAEEIQDEAIKCKHCMEFLEDTKEKEQIQEQEKEPSKQEVKEASLKLSPTGPGLFGLFILYSVASFVISILVLNILEIDFDFVRKFPSFSLILPSIGFIGVLLSAIFLKKPKKAIKYFAFSLPLVLIWGVTFGIQYNTYQKYLKAVERGKQIKKQETPVNKETAKSISLGLSESSKKSAFYDLVILQDEYMNKDPYNTQKQQDAYKIIANKYKISEKEMRKIVVEGVQKKWPQPPIK